MLLKQLLRDCPVTVAGELDLEVDRVVCDSRDAGKGALFVAIRGGQEVDRHAFVGDAIRRGAVAAVVEDEMDCTPATRILVDDSRRILPILACRLAGEPARELRCAGVTGTNGKTTTAWLLHNILQQATGASAYLGTLGFQAGDRPMETIANTTPEAPVLQALLRRARSCGCRAISMEVSSHALALHRTAGIDFEVALFTNLTRDHLDFHGTLDDYLAAKGLLFEGLSSGATAVLNRDDPAWEALAQRTEARILTYSLEDPAADVRPLSVDASMGQTRLKMIAPTGEFDVHSPLTGRFNWSNIVAALAGGIALGVTTETLREGIAQATRVPGRFEQIDEGQPFAVLVDYAHTPGGLLTVLEAARELTQGRLICVFGCGGDRDAGKRPLMGKVAEELADLIFLTSDNPRSEPPEQILQEIAAGMSAVDVFADVDRQRAIEAALQQAVAGDVVVIAGKGDEPYQVLADGTIDFDDRQVARDALRAAR